MHPAGSRGHPCLFKPRQCVADTASERSMAFCCKQPTLHCVVQRNNCLGNSAEIPALPDPPPMAAFRGDPLTHELAESLFIGWLGMTSSHVYAAAGSLSC